MAQTAAHLVDHVIPHVPVRQWVLSLPIPLRLLLAALKADEADSGAVTLIQRFGSAANLNVSHRLRPARRPEGADAARRDAEGTKRQTGSVRRYRPIHHAPPRA